MFEKVCRLAARGQVRSFSSIKNRTNQAIVGTYARYDITLSKGQGSYIWDETGKKYLDFGGGIAVSCLGHGHPELVETLTEQASKFMHISNLYYHEAGADAADRITRQMGGGKVFFSNSGAEANEGLFKLARKHGCKSELESGRYEVITALNSFHGRTLGGLSATGQDKIKKYFFPTVDGFKHVPFNNLEAMEAAVGEHTAAILIEGIQGEGGIISATPEYLWGLRELCDKHGILLMWDGVQCGHFRSGRFQSYQRILEGTPDADKFQPDAVSMAKSLGGGFPMGAIWVRDPFQEVLTAGSHGTTYGGNPMGCAVAAKIMDIIERDGLEQNIREKGQYLTDNIKDMASLFPNVINTVRGEGLMLGIEIAQGAFKDKTGSSGMVSALHHHGVLTVPSGDNIVRLLPPYNITQSECDELLEALGTACSNVTGQDQSFNESEAIKKLKENF